MMLKMQQQLMESRYQKLLKEILYILLILQYSQIMLLQVISKLLQKVSI